MQDNWLSRTSLLLGDENLEKLKSKNVLIIGLGGVGATAAEMICRAGVGKMTIVDSDIVNNTNINRQLIALHSNIGDSKSAIMGKRLKDINPDIKLNIINEFVEEGLSTDILSTDFDYVVDAIDTLSPKIYLIYYALQMKLNIVSSMGAGGKIDPSLVQISDLKNSFNCNLARSLRKRLRRLGVNGDFPVVFSPEGVSSSAVIDTPDEQNKKTNVGTISYMPSLFGIFCASKVIRDLIDG